MAACRSDCTCFSRRLASTSAVRLGGAWRRSRCTILALGRRLVSLRSCRHRCRQRPDTFVPGTVAHEVDTIIYCPTRGQVRRGSIRESPAAVAVSHIDDPDILLTL